MDENGKSVRLGFNTDVVLGILVAGLLGWVAMTTHLNQLATLTLTERFSAYAGQTRIELVELRTEHDADRAELAQAVKDIKLARERIYSRLRYLEHAAAIPPAAGAIYRDPGGVP